jgi:DNA polymerase III alpha subunit
MKQDTLRPTRSAMRRVSVATMERLADADAFRSMDLDRRSALWEVAALHDRPDCS